MLALKMNRAYTIGNQRTASRISLVERLKKYLKDNRKEIACSLCSMSGTPESLKMYMLIKYGK